MLGQTSVLKMEFNLSITVSISKANYLTKVFFFLQNYNQIKHFLSLILCEIYDFEFKHI